MKIKNLTTKAIGFGSVTVLPDQTGDTPKGFGKGHPVVDYYLSRGWIKEIGAAADGAETSGAPVDVQVGLGGAGTAAKPLDRMNKEELTALAVEMGVEVAETDTKQMIIDKIKAAKQENV